MTRFSRLSIPLAFLAAGLSLPALAADPIPMTPDRWELSDTGASFETYLGRPALKLNRGRAAIKGESFKDGTIEFDIALPDARGFAGLYFREREGDNSEEFYLRTHLSGMPDANQYTPVFNGVNAWQLLHGPRYSAPTPYHFGDWTHVRLVVLGNQMDVYIDSEEPVLHVGNLFHGMSEGGIRFNAAVSDYYYSNVTVDHTAPTALKGKAAPLPDLKPSLLKGFSVAKRLVNSADVEAKPALDPALLDGQDWGWIKIDEAGSANLARLGRRAKGADTQLVRLSFKADKAQTVKLDYGFSDRATAFLNGKAIAYGDDSYASRDYRFLGTIGLYDSVFLPLEAGDNELIIAVSEGFGGWGVMAAFEAPTGVSVH